MAIDASDCLQDLIAAGHEVPYEVSEAGGDSPLCRYQPLSERFVRDHAGELRRLDSFGAACAALEASELAERYLEQAGVDVPPEPRRRAELAGLVFLCRLWPQSTDFTLDDARLERALAELEAAGEAELGQIEVIVPLRGLQMPVSRLDLAGCSIVRADTVDVPAEARSADGLGISPWEPTFLAAVCVDDPGGGDEHGAPGSVGVEGLRDLISMLRLFKAGGVGLGPHAWARSGGDRWRRIATGSGRPRPGGYRLAETELGELVSFSEALTRPGTPFSRRANDRPGFPAMLARSLARFEAGLERNVVIEALNDQLLCLRFLLEGSGPASLGMPMRVAALCAEPERRDEIKAVVDRAAGLERELWSGEPAPGARGMTAAETALELEELARAILKDGAVGHLGSDLRTTADEILLADGLAVGEGSSEQRGTTTEWELEPVSLQQELDEISAEVSEVDRRINETDEPTDQPEEETLIARAREIFEPELDLEPEREAPSREQGAGSRQTDLSDLSDLRPLPPPEFSLEQRATSNEQRATDPERRTTNDERRERSSDSSPLLRLIEQTRAEGRAHRERAAGLFPEPETTEWKVREVAYDRTRRARVS